MSSAHVFPMNDARNATPGTERAKYSTYFDGLCAHCTRPIPFGTAVDLLSLGWRIFNEPETHWTCAPCVDKGLR